MCDEGTGTLAAARGREMGSEGVRSQIPVGAGNSRGVGLVSERNKLKTVYVGALDERVTELLLWELMIQAGRVRHIYIPRDRLSGAPFGYAFVEFQAEHDAAYAVKVLNMVRLFGKPIRVQSTSEHATIDVGANLFVGNIHMDVDEKILHDVFSAFGSLVETPHVARDPTTGESKQYAFVKYDNFASSDAAINAMNGQYLMNQPISVQYAFKKDSKRERHGSEAERLLAHFSAIQQQQQQQQQYTPGAFANPSVVQPVVQPVELAVGAIPPMQIPSAGLNASRQAIPASMPPLPPTFPGPAMRLGSISSSASLPPGMPPLPFQPQQAPLMASDSKQPPLAPHGRNG
ncbi:Splicing factor 3B subunit 4 [Porphyridium purpureum]|uniref:Splicing factor 3B subunit 4 n=1 Tax=Porphyridium purpureum TaxID=35688 RepID=A0A5J4Z313_PORPP|nr:Splicing factor 3B subunit 4 [Porphyridium purpureum]|eukprot:POR5796..scf295_1